MSLTCVIRAVIRLALICMLVACGANPAPATQPPPGPAAPLANSTSATPDTCRAPDTCLQNIQFTEIGGRVYGPADFAGKVVVVHFWATWAKSAMKMQPGLNAAVARNPESGLLVLGVLANDQSDDVRLRSFITEHAIAHPVVRATSEIMTAFEHPDALPMTFVFDRRGRRVWHQLGGLTEEALAAKLEPLLAQP